MDAQPSSPHQDVFLAGGATVKGDDIQVGDVVNMDGIGRLTVAGLLGTVTKRGKRAPEAILVKEDGDGQLSGGWRSVSAHSAVK